MRKFAEKVRELLCEAEKADGFHEAEVTFSIRLQGGNESYFLRLMSERDRPGEEVSLAKENEPENGQWF